MPSKSDSARINGAKSRGPTSEAGRARSSQNALKHGLCSQALLLPSEDPSEFHDLLAAYIQRLQPDGPVELDLVHEMVAAKWRLDRIAIIETQLFADAIADEEDRSDHPLTPTEALAGGFERLANRNSLTVLHRMESRLARAYSRALRNLLQLQKLRQPPAAPDPGPADGENKICKNEPTGPPPTSAKLEREPVEDYRIDFEDGYGNRPDSEEDGHALSTAQAVARGAGQPGFPPFIGIRIKPFTEILRSRAMRTLDLFLTTLLAESGALPKNFVVTLPKVTVPEQVAALTKLLAAIESKHALPLGALKLELMIETPQSIFDSSGAVAIPKLLEAADGRCRGLHFGVYDYTASSNVTAEYQSMVHPACDFARHVMQVSSAGRGVTLSDGATNIMPVPKHRAAPGASLTAQQSGENRAVIRKAMRLHFEHVQRSLMHAYYQGWDLHPGQLPTRYAAVYAFFLQSFEPAAARLRNFVEKAAQATLVGEVFDDAATGQGLLNFFLRGINCGAFTEAEASTAGVTLDELRGRSFVKILENRRRSQSASPTAPSALQP